MSIAEVKVPDIGDVSEVEVIELMVKVGDIVEVDQSLITVESDKASMEIPSSHAGIIKELKVKLGDKVKEGSLVLLLENTSAISVMPVPTAVEAVPTAVEAVPTAVEAVPTAVEAVPTAVEAVPTAVEAVSGSIPHASPSVRKFARELGVNLRLISGTGRKARITHEDIQNYIKSTLSIKGTISGVSSGSDRNIGVELGLLAWPSLDFSKQGPTEPLPLSRIKKFSGQNLHRNWVMIPHITQFDEVDITELEEFRRQTNNNFAKTNSPVKLTMLAFVIKATISALKKFQEFNSSLDRKGENLILKQYYNIGIAVNTSNGLVVPVIKEADKKGIGQIAQKISELSAQARNGRLGLADTQGATFTISSLGGIGGTAFTPIINAPEVAILGLSKASIKPVWDGKQFVPRLMMPTSLSYDHRVVDGALGAHFSVYLAEMLADIRKILL